MPLWMPYVAHAHVDDLDLDGRSQWVDLDERSQWVDPDERSQWVDKGKKSALNALNN